MFDRVSSSPCFCCILLVCLFYNIDVKVLVAQPCLTLSDPTQYNLPGFSFRGKNGSFHSPGKNGGVGSHSLLQRSLPDPAVEPGSPVLQADSLLSEAPGKPL